MWQPQLNSIYEGGVALSRNLLLPHHRRWSMYLQPIRITPITADHWRLPRELSLPEGRHTRSGSHGDLDLQIGALGIPC
jgi:hypothetical protein